MSFVLVAKTADHKILFKYVEEIAAMGEAGTLELVDIKIAVTFTALNL